MANREPLVYLEVVQPARPGARFEVVRGDYVLEIYFTEAILTFHPYGCNLKYTLRSTRKPFNSTIMARFYNETQSQMKKPRLRCAPLSSLVDEKITITIEGLKPFEKVTLRARLVGDSQDKYYSFAHFVSDNEGKVCVSSQPSTGGFYQGVDPMGLLCSMKAEPGQRKGLRLFKRDVTKPYLVDLTAFRGHVIGDKTCDDVAVCSLAFEKWYMGEGVRRIPVRDGNVRGTLFLPPGKGSFPGILDMFGSSGKCSELKASLLASRGFAALALAYFLYEDLPQKLEDITLEYFIEAKEWLRHHPQVTPGGVGVMGVSKGSDIALFLAANSPDLRAIVSVSPFYGFMFTPMSYKGQITTHIPMRASNAFFEEDGSVNTRNCYQDDWKGDIRNNPHVIQVENIQCPVLFICGEDDRCNNVEDSITKLMQRAEAFGKGTEQFTVLRYPRAGHLIELPYMPHCYMTYHPYTGVCLTMGGEPKGHAAAQEHSWRNILDFFASNLPSKIGSKL